jgi:hypothetical protein
MAAPRFQVGDRVRASVTVFYIRAGMLGTVRYVFKIMKGAYLVQFDELPYLDIMAEEMLEAVELERGYSR